MEMASWYTKNVEEYYTGNKEQLEGVLGGNALKLFPKFHFRRMALEDAQRGTITPN